MGSAPAPSLTRVFSQPRFARGTVKSVGGCPRPAAAGPTGNSYGDPPGHTCMAVIGAVTAVRTLRTGSEDRVANMWAFAEATLKFFVELLETAPS